MDVDALALRVRDRHLIRTAAQRVYTDRTASASPEDILVAQAILEGFWEPRTGSTDREAFLGIAKAIGKLLDLFKRAPRAWEAIKEALGIPEMGGLGWTEKAKVLGSKLRELATAGFKALGAALRKAVSTFPLSIFFVPAHKAPGLTDLITRILKKSPRVRALLEKIHSGAERVDTWLKKYIPKLSRALYAAIFIWVWLNVSELSWDIDGILAGFTGRISLGDLLGSMPESGLGAIAAAFGLGYGALPYALIARILWLVANHYLEWVPGKGLRVKWQALGVEERDELVPT